MKKNIKDKTNSIKSKPEKSNTHIKCDVSTCEYNNVEDNSCELNTIKVHHQYDDEVTSKEETICDSFKCGCDDCRCNTDDEMDDNEEEE